VATVISSGQTSTCALEGSTEVEQFENNSSNGHGRSNGRNESVLTSGYLHANGHGAKSIDHFNAMFERFDPEEVALMPSGD
jgi:hypothetical protein